MKIKMKISTTTFIVIAIVFLALIMQGCKGESKAGVSGELEQSVEQPKEQPRAEKAAQLPDTATVKDAKDAVSDFVKNTLNDAYWPDSFEPVPKLLPNGKIDANAPDDIYGLLWEKGGTKFFIRAIIKAQAPSSEPIKLTAKTDTNAKSADELTSLWANYLKEHIAAESFSCEEQKVFEAVGTLAPKFTVNLFCNYIKIKENSDKTIITAITYDGKTSLFVCGIPKGSVNYNATSCYR